MRPILQKIIDLVHNAFVPKRIIHDNIFAYMWDYE